MGDDVRVSDKDIAAAEAEVRAKADAAAAKVRAEATEQVRKEFEAEQRLKDAEAKASQSTEQLKQLQEQLEAMKRANDELLAKKVEERLAEADAKRKAFVPPSQNPFATPPKASPVEGISPEKMRDIELASYEALLARGSVKK